jgi:predicted N-formylglutamate amidohydrolase
MTDSDHQDNSVQQEFPLLGPGDPAPVSIVNPTGSAPVLLICDHASNAVPAALHGLGLVERDLHRHIAYDIGAAEVTRLLAAGLDGPAVLAGYSRLVIDTNRHLHHSDSIVGESDGTIIPGNEGISSDDVRARTEACFWPYHRRIGSGLAGFAMRGQRPAVISIHAYTPVLGGVERPWHIGVLWGDDARISGPLIAALRAHEALAVGDNQPYSGHLDYGYSMNVHAGETGLPHVLIELREDLISTVEDQERTATILVDALSPILADPALYRIEEG